MTEIPSPRQAHRQFRALPRGERRQLKLWLNHSKPHPDPQTAALLAGLARWQQRTAIGQMIMVILVSLVIAIAQIAAGDPDRIGWRSLLGVGAWFALLLGILLLRLRRVEKLNQTAASKRQAHSGPVVARLAWYDVMSPTLVLAVAAPVGAIGALALWRRPSVFAVVAVLAGVLGVVRFAEGVVGRRRRRLAT